MPVMNERTKSKLPADSSRVVLARTEEKKLRLNVGASQVRAAFGQLDVRPAMVAMWSSGVTRKSSYVIQPSSLALSLASCHALARNSDAVMVTRGSFLFAISAAKSPGESVSLKYLTH